MEVWARNPPGPSPALLEALPQAQSCQGESDGLCRLMSPCFNSHDVSGQRSGIGFRARPGTPVSYSVTIKAWVQAAQVEGMQLRMLADTAAHRAPIQPLLRAGGVLAPGPRPPAAHRAASAGP